MRQTPTRIHSAPDHRFEKLPPQRVRATFVTLVALLFMAVVAGLPTQVVDAEELEAKLAAARSADDHREVVKLLTGAIDGGSAPDNYWYWRARANFCLGKVEDAVADFDRYIERSPGQKSRQWERGIALYYAGEFEKGAQQFELYQTYHDNDVENSVWRFLCLVPTVGLEEARGTMLPIRHDPRVPMMPIYALYQGKASLEEVWDAVNSGNPTQAQLAGRRFYAQLYIGLYHEARGETELAREQLLAAADEHKRTEQVNRYMWEVARVHAERFRAAAERAAE